jgi:hypothetical protein
MRRNYFTLSEAWAYWLSLPFEVRRIVRFRVRVPYNKEPTNG